MGIFSWFNSPDQIDTALLCVAIVGALIELGVAVAAVINVHKAIEESRKKKLEKYIEILACVAAFFFVAKAILGWRSSMLLSQDLERLKRDNLKLYQEIQPRRISPAQKSRIMELLGTDQGRARIEVNVDWWDPERIILAKQVSDVLTDCGFNVQITGINEVRAGGVITINFGILMETHDLNKPPAFAAKIANAFNKASVPMSAVAVPSFGTNDARIVVGNKPLLAP